MKQLFIIFVLALAQTLTHAAEITIIGGGYVGLTLAGSFLQYGHTVQCVETNPAKCAMLNNQQLYIYEPHLKELLFEDTACRFTAVGSLEESYPTSLYFICVPTPVFNGECDASFVIQAMDDLIYHATKNQMNTSKIVCVKSTLPPGSMRKLQALIEVASLKETLQLIYNPEFMREGSAFADINNNPIVLGGESKCALDTIEHLYQGCVRKTEVIKTTYETAEMIKYAWNAFSALRIAYVNELALISREYQADIATVVQGFALSEQLLPTQSIRPGPGIGGACLLKDSDSFASIFSKNGFDFSLVHCIRPSNQAHIQYVIEDILKAIEEPAGKTVAILGLSFKAGTNDIRNAPSIAIIQALSTAGVILHAYDPQAMEEMRSLFPAVSYFTSAYNAVENADCVVVLTEWEEIKNIDLERVSQLVRKKVMIDTKNIFDTRLLKKYEFTYFNMGAL